MPQVSRPDFKRIGNAVREVESNKGSLGASGADWDWGRAKSTGITYPLHITAQVNEASGVLITDASFAIDEITINNPAGASWSDSGDHEEPVLCYNGKVKFAFDDDAWIYAVWSDDADGADIGTTGYIVVQGDCPV